MKKGWEIKRLGEVVQIKNGRNQSKVVNSNGQYPIYGSGGIMGYADDFLCDEGCTIIGRKGSINNPIYVTTKFWNVDTAFGFSPMASLNSKLLYYFCLSFNFKKLDKGTTLPSLTKTDLSLIEIPLPALPEQQRIVSILDETFTAIALAKANAEQNLQNAKELFESYLQGVFENKGKGWKVIEFGEVINILTDYHANGSYEILKENVELKDTEDYAWMIRSTDFEKNFKNDFRYIDKKGYDFLKKSKVFGGEIIISKIGNAGKVYLMPKIDRPCSLAMNLFLVKVDEKKAIPEFIYQYLNSSFGEVQIKSRLNGATTKTITKDNVRNINIPIPSLSEQQTIVQKLDDLSAETKRLEGIYVQKIADLEELKKSVLEKAFRGELA